MLILILELTLLFVVNLKNVSFDSNFEKLFPKNDPETEYIQEFRGKFSSENDYLLLIVEREEGIFNQSFLLNIDSLIKELELLEHVQYVSAITNQKELYRLANGEFQTSPYLNLSQISKIQDSTRLFQKKELIQSLLGDDGKSVSIFVRNKDLLDKEAATPLLDSINNLLKDYHFDNTRIVGRIYAQHYVIGKMSFEMTLFLGLSAFLIVIFLYIAFRSVWGIIIPQIVLFGGFVWLLGGMALFNEPITILLTVMPSIMFVVSMSDVIHLVSRYLDALRQVDSNFTAIKIAVKEVGMATFLTSLTTAVGFFSLYFVQIEPIQNFGIILGFGVLIAFVLTYALLPILFYWFPGPKRIVKIGKTQFWKKKLAIFFIFILKKKQHIVLISVGVLILSIIGLSQLNANNYQMDDLSDKDELKQDLNYINKHYGGSRSFAMVIELKDDQKNMWQLETLMQVDSIQNLLEIEMELVPKSSLVNAIKIMNRNFHGGDTSYYALPETENELAVITKILQKTENQHILSRYIDSTQTAVQINGFLKDAGRVKVSINKANFENKLASYQFNHFDCHFTGTAHLVDKTMSYLVSSMLKGLLLSIFMVSLCIGFLFKSFKIALISLIPNLIPLIILAGMMGVFGIELKMSTAIIFSIAFGIVVDDTIHFLAKYNYELKKGKSALIALKSSYLTTGEAMILTTLILCAGFCLMVFSGFQGTFYLGLLLSLVLFIALICDLTLLPILLAYFYSSKS